jgi:hypothetical protein
MMGAIHAGKDIEESIADVATMAALFHTLIDDYLDCRMILGSTRGDGKVLCLFLCSSIVYNEGRSPLFLR